MLARMATVKELHRCWEDILDMATRHVFEKDAIIPHKKLRGIYYISSGSVSIFYITPDGQERLTLRIGPGCLFNEARSISQYNPEGIFYSTSKTVIWRFPENILQEETFIAAHPRQIASLVRSMGIKMLIHYTFLADMGAGNHEAHVCRFILDLSRCHDNSRIFPSPMTQCEVASLIGIHRATLLRILHNLKKKGVIARFTQREIVILDLPLLEELALQS